MAHSRIILWDQSPFSVPGCHVSVLVGWKGGKGEFSFMQNEIICITCVKFICKTPPPNFALKHRKQVHKNIGMNHKLM